MEEDDDDEARVTVTIECFNDHKGFEGGEDLFVHRSSIRSECFFSYGEGEQVEFVICAGDDGGTNAVVTGPDGGAVKGVQSLEMENLYLYYYFHLNFSLSGSKPRIKDLASGTLNSESIQRISKVHDQYLEFLALEDNLFSLVNKSCYVQLNYPSASNREIWKTIEKIVSRLSCVLATMNDHLLAKNNLSSEDGGFASSFQRPILCLFDWNFELFVAIQSYRPLVRDVLGLAQNSLFCFVSTICGLLEDSILPLVALESSVISQVAHDFSTICGILEGFMPLILLALESSTISQVAFDLQQLVADFSLSPLFVAVIEAFMLLHLLRLESSAISQVASCLQLIWLQIFICYFSMFCLCIEAFYGKYGDFDMFSDCLVQDVLVEIQDLAGSCTGLNLLTSFLRCSMVMIVLEDSRFFEDLVMASGASSIYYTINFDNSGAQAVGMGQEARNLPAAPTLYEKVNEVLGFDFLEVCLNGPKEKLGSTISSHPAIYVTSLIVVKVLSAREGILLGMRNPLLGISAVVDEEFLRKYDANLNNVILAEEKHLPMYDELSAKEEMQFNGSIVVYKKTLKSDGIAAGLYRGFNMSCVSIIVYRVLYFGLYDFVKPMLPEKMQDSFFPSFALGWVTTNGAGIASRPIETSGKAVKYKSSIDAFKHILKNEGVKSLFKGADVLSGYDKFQMIVFGKKYGSGGATQNSIRVAQWMLQVPVPTSCMGSNGKNKYSDEMKKNSKLDGLNLHCYKDASAPIGTCAVCAVGGERLLIANLLDANCYKSEHLKKPENWALVKKAKYFYIDGVFHTISPESLQLVAEHVAANNKVFAMNLTITFICEFFKDAQKKVLPYIDYVFRNETEARILLKVHGWETECVEEIAIKISQLPKASGTHKRITVIGKINHVLSFNLVSGCTVKVVIMRQAEKKLQLNHSVVGKDHVDQEGKGTGEPEAGYLQSLIFGLHLLDPTEIANEDSDEQNLSELGALAEKLLTVRSKQQLDKGDQKVKVDAVDILKGIEMDPTTVVYPDFDEPSYLLRVEKLKEASRANNSIELELKNKKNSTEEKHQRADAARKKAEENKLAKCESLGYHSLAIKDPIRNPNSDVMLDSGSVQDLHLGNLHLVEIKDDDGAETKYDNALQWVALDILQSYNTRMTGVMVMVHGDDKSLVLPPKVATLIVVFVPHKDANTAEIMKFYSKFVSILSAAGLCVEEDTRENYSPGWEYSHWEMKSVPLRFEIGPKDLANKQVLTVCHDNSTKGGHPC